MLPSRLNDKPHYVLHPVRLARRALHAAGRGPGIGGGDVTTQLPWGLPLTVNSGEAIGFSIVTGGGIFDPCVTEAVHRLVDPGDVVVDVGANVGYLTSLAAVRAGASGTVHAFEPHPHVFGMLNANVEAWGRHPEAAPVHAHRAALSDRQGSGALDAGPQFGANMGLSSLQPEAAAMGSDLHDVVVERLDHVMAEQPIGLLKIDVEGHEPEVLRGAMGLLEAGLVRDLVFEDHEPYPDASTELVEAAGYRLFSLTNDLFGLDLKAPAERGPTSAWPGPSYLATRNPDRALSRLGPRGWQVAGIGLTPPWKVRRAA